MRVINRMVDYGGTMIASPRETMLLGRIGRELALVYHDTLHAPLTPTLQALVERLHHASLMEEPIEGEG